MLGDISLHLKMSRSKVIGDFDLWPIFIIIFLFRCDCHNSSRHIISDTLRQVSVWLTIENLRGTVPNFFYRLRNYAPLFSKNTCSAEQAKTITDIRNLIGGMSRGTDGDVSSTKKNFAKSVADYAFLTYFLEHFLTSQPFVVETWDLHHSS